MTDHIAANKKVQPAPAPLPESENVAEALAVIADAGLGAVAEGLRLHIEGLTRRLAEAEARPLIPAGAHVSIHTPPMPKSELISHLQSQIMDLHKDLYRLREAAELRAAVLKQERDGLASLCEQHEARVRELTKAIFAARNCGIFGCCPFCGAGWESSDERHSLTCPVPSAKAALAATEAK